MTTRTTGTTARAALLCLIASSCISVGTPSDNSQGVNATDTGTNTGNYNQGGTGAVQSGGTALSNGSSTVNPNTMTGNGNTQAPSGGNTQVTNPGNTPAPAPIVPVSGSDRFTLVGRFDLQNPNVLKFTWLSTKVGVRFTGTSIAIDVASSNNGDGFNIELDGNIMPPLMLNSQATTRRMVVSDLPSTTHVLWLTKRTEFNQAGSNTLTISDMIVDSNATFLTPPSPRPRRIEVIGDSGMAGYGVDQLVIPNDPTHPACGYTPATQNGDKSVVSNVGRALNAEVVNLSWSGRGVVASQFAGDPNQMFPVLYNELVGGDLTRPWDFSKVLMDVVVLGGGANDFIGNSGSGAVANPAQFIKVYSDWMVRIRGYYPKALIVAAIGANAKGQDRVSMAQYLTQAVQSAQAKMGPTGDANMIYFDYYANDPNGWMTYDDVATRGQHYWGCSFHPSITGSEWLAERMTAVIRTHMGW